MYEENTFLNKIVIFLWDQTIFLKNSFEIDTQSLGNMLHNLILTMFKNVLKIGLLNIHLFRLFMYWKCFYSPSNMVNRFSGYFSLF